MNRTLLSAAVAFAVLGSIAIAQQTSPTSPDSSQPAAKWHHHRANPQKQAAMLSRTLNLTPDQAARIEPILADRDQKLSTLHTDTTLAREDRRTKMEAIRLDTQQQLANILTPEQMQKMQSMHHRRGGRGEQAPAATSGL